MEDLKSHLRNASRPALLAFLANAMSELTLHGRSSGDDEHGHSKLKRINEAVHHLAGHMRDLFDHDEPVTDSRIDGMAEHLSVLAQAHLHRILPAAD
ncbi:MAG TPA: hypothetical protein VGL66_05550 [Caulobacteraceae bacterium]|jgi:hypothetical protein